MKLDVPGPTLNSPVIWATFCCCRLPAASRTSPTTIIAMTAPENR